jgi:hypothetical protein
MGRNVVSARMGPFGMLTPKIALAQMEQSTTLKPSRVSVKVGNIGMEPYVSHALEIPSIGTGRKTSVKTVRGENNINWTNKNASAHRANHLKPRQSVFRAICLNTSILCRSNVSTVKKTQYSMSPKSNVYNARSRHLFRSKTDVSLVLMI